MSALIHKFLLVGPWNKNLSDMGAVIVTDLYEANYQFERCQIDVLGVNSTVILEKKFGEQLERWQLKNPQLQIVLVIPKDFSKKLLLELQLKYQFYKIFITYDDKNIETDLNLTLERAYSEKQYESYQKLWSEQNTQLENLKLALDEKIEKRTRFLLESRRKLFLTNIRIEAFRKAMTAVHLSKTQDELEQNLNSELLRTFEIQWIKVFKSPLDDQFASDSSHKLEYKQLRIKLHLESEEIGSIFFMRSLQKQFSKEEIEFLSRISEAVSLALDRIEKRQKLESVHTYWKDLFKAIKDPILLIDSEYRVIQSNSDTIPETQLCFKALFNRNSPCESCQIGKNFDLKDKSVFFSVSGQMISIESRKYYIHYYRDRTNTHNLRQELSQLAPKAELGILSSSIAHEINNPLAGLLSYTQIMIMDLKPNDPLFADMKSIEAAVKKCSEKVNELLVESRK